MSIIQIVAKELAGNEHLNGQWPSITDEDGEVLTATRVYQYGSYTLEFDEPVWPYSYRGSEVEYTTEIDDVEGLPHQNPYYSDEGDSVTREEYEAYVLATVGGDHSKLAGYFADLVRTNVAKIAELNEQVGKLVDQIADLAYEAGIPAEIDLGGRGSLDLDGPWDSSSAYC